MNPEPTVEERLRRLESQVRRARMWSVATTVALGAVVFASMQAPEAKELNVDKVTARQFTLVDEAGHMRGSFGPDGRVGADEKAVALELMGPDAGGNRVRLLAGASINEITLKDAEHRSQVWIAVDEKGGRLSAGSPPAQGGGMVCFNATLSCEEGEGRLSLLAMEKVKELSNEGSTAVRSSATIQVTPTGGVVRK